MIAIDPTILIILVEVTIGLLVLVVILSFFLLKGRRPRVQVPRDLQGIVEKGKAERIATLSALIRERRQLDEAQANTLASKLVDQEQAFYTALVQSYTRQDGEGIALVKQQAAKVLDIYADSMGPAPARPAQGGNDKIEALNQEIERLRQENEALTAKWKESEDKMSQILGEYASAYGDGSKRGETQLGKGIGELLLHPGESQTDQDQAGSVDGGPPEAQASVDSEPPEAQPSMEADPLDEQAAEESIVLQEQYSPPPDEVGGDATSQQQDSVAEDKEGEPAVAEEAPAESQGQAAIGDDRQEELNAAIEEFLDASEPQQQKE